jgi:dipeptidyl aminopeptidase/acylaminoacyl peptidase
VAYDEGTRTHLFVVPSSGGTPKDLTPGRWDAVPFELFSSADEYDFSPDSRELVFAANRTETPWSNINWDLFTVPVAGGDLKRITSNTAPDQQPRYSPDGRFIAYRASRRYNYESDRMELMIYDRQSGAFRSLTQGFDRWVQNLYWAPGSKRLYFTAEDQGNVPIFTVSLEGDDVKTVVGGRAWNEGVCLSRDGNLLAFTRRDLARTPEVYTATTNGGRVEPLTNINEAFFKRVRTLEGEEVRYRGAGGAEVHGFVIKPSGFDPAKKYPLVVVIHGGPQQMFGNAFRSEFQLYAAEGYVVFFPNPRGSPGYGQKFIDEINRDWDGKVVDDIMAGVDYMVQTGYVDASRMCATGGSFGGFVVNWIAGHSTKFKCLISHAGLANQWSMYGSTDELHFPEWEFGGPPWEQPEVYNRYSPVFYAKNFKTPMLITHGELDFRVPITEGEQMFTALQRQGVPSKMLRFPDEGHWILKPKNAALWYRTMLEWCAGYLK